MANKILIKSSQDAGDDEEHLYNGGSGNQKLHVAELALNTKDGVLFMGQAAASESPGDVITAATNVYSQPMVVSTAAQTVGTASSPSFAGLALTGALTTNSTIDGVDIATRDAILTSTTTTAGAALPKTGGAMTGAITTNSTFDGVDVAACNTTANAALPKAGGTMTGPLLLDDTSLQFGEGVDTLTITAPTLTAARAITFPDSSGEVAMAADVTAAALGLQVGTNVRAKTVNRSITGVACTSGSAAVTCTAAAIQIGDEILTAGTGVPDSAYVASITSGTEGVNVTAFTLGAAGSAANADATGSSLTWTLAGIDNNSSAWTWATTNGGTLTRGSDLIMTTQWDGVTLATNDIILVTNQTNNPEQNGIYTVTTAPGASASLVLTRHDDYDLAAEFPNSFTFVTEGTAAADTSWVCTNDGSLTLNTTAIAFEQFNAPGNVTAGTGMAKSGNTISASNIPTTTGGTGITSYTTGDILYASDTNTLSKLAVGTDGKVLKLASGVPTWATHAGGLSDLVDDTTPQLGADLDTNGFDIQLDADKSISFDGSTAGQTLIGDGDGITYTVPASDTHDFNVTSTGTVLSVGADTLTTRAGAAHTISVGAAAGANTASGALTISAGTATGNAVGGAITLKTGGAAGSSGSSATTAVNALVLAAAGGATFLNTVTMNGALDGATMNGGSF